MTKRTGESATVEIGEAGPSTDTQLVCYIQPLLLSPVSSQSWCCKFRLSAETVRAACSGVGVRSSSSSVASFRPPLARPSQAHLTKRGSQSPAATAWSSDQPARQQHQPPDSACRSRHAGSSRSFRLAHGASPTLSSDEPSAQLRLQPSRPAASFLPSPTRQTRVLCLLERSMRRWQLQGRSTRLSSTSTPSAELEGTESSS